MDSLYALEEWAGICKTHEKNLPLLLVGTKSDLANQRTVLDDAPREYIKDLKCMEYFEVSSKTGENVEIVFETIAKAILGIG